MTPGEVPAEVVAAAKHADHEEGVCDGRSYHEVADHQVRRLVAGAVMALSGNFSRDPEALAWARGHVERVAAKYEAFEAQDRKRGDEERALQWHKYVSLLHREFIGGTGCVITAFDERLPSLPEQDEVA